MLRMEDGSDLNVAMSFNAEEEHQEQARLRRGGLPREGGSLLRTTPRCGKLP
jgi:hypothetical protein